MGADYAGGAMVLTVMKELSGLELHFNTKGIKWIQALVIQNELRRGRR
jgi:hypothetical protein